MKSKRDFQNASRPTRRSFVKGTAALVSAAGMSCLVGWTDADKDSEQSDTEKNEAAANTEEQVFPGTCMGFCSGACALNLHVRDGKLRRVSMREMEDPKFNRICPKGLTHPYRAYCADRVLAPLRRAGERGAGEWEQITWDEAIAEIAEKWKAITDEFGPSAMINANAVGNCGIVNGMLGGPMRFRMAMGMSSLEMDADWGHEYSVDNRLMRSVYNTTNGPEDLANAKTIFVWAANPAASQLQAVHFLTEARDNGATLIVIDPTFNANASLADMFVPIKPATDGALALGMCNLIIENGWQDEEFLAKASVAPFLVNPETHAFMRLSDLNRAEAGSEDDAIVVMDAEGNLDVPEAITAPALEGTTEINGVTYTTAYSLLLERLAEWPVSRASEITGIPEETIQELTRLYAQETPSTIYTVYGADHYVNGHFNYDCIFTLGMLTGNFGKPGYSVGSILSNGLPFLNFGFAGGAPVPEGGLTPYHVIHFADACLTGKYNGEDFPVKGLFCLGKNVVSGQCDRLKTIEALKKLELIVVVDPMMSDTANYADYVLPASYWFEAEDVMGVAHSHPYVMYSAKAIEPLGDSKPDFEIVKLLADALGVGEYLDYTPEEYLQNILDSDYSKEIGLTYEVLKEKGMFRYIPEGYLYAPDGVFGTETGRAQFYWEKPVPSNDDPSGYDFDKQYLPFWEEAQEAGEHSEIRQTYPFHLIQEHSRLRTHTQWSEVEALMELEGEQYVFINPEDAEALGISDGDTIRIYNDRGSLTTYARLRANNQPGVVSAIKGWNTHQVIDGHLGNLTLLESNPFCANQPFNDCAVAIEKL